jgi:hypothetical protein
MKERLATPVIMIISLLVITTFRQPTLAQGRQDSERNTKTVAGPWYIFTSPDRDFKLAFPRKPSREPDDQGLVTLIRAYSVTTENGMHFSVNFQDIGGDPRARRNNTYEPMAEDMMTDAARQRGERVVQVHRIAKNIIEMELWQTAQGAGDNINYLTRNIVHRGRIFTLGCGSVINNIEVDKTICRCFFNSIRFTR